MPAYDTMLAALADFALRNPDLEATVYWHRDGQWSGASDDPLEAEEIAFYAEGLLMEGFGLAWDHLQMPGLDDQVRLCFWQGVPPMPPALPDGSVRLSGGSTLD